MRRNRYLPAGLAAVLALALAGCGASNSSKSASAPTVTTPSEPAGNGGVYTVTTATGVTSTSSTTTTSTTGTTSTGQCTAAQLHPVLLSGQGAAGTDIYVVALRNVSSSSCRTYGYPGVSFLNATGAALPTNVTRTTTDAAGNATASAITLTPGEEASFRVAVAVAYEGGEYCKTATTMQIYPPESTVALKLALSGGGSQVCGKATVIPLQSGSSASPS